jgi:hypothetical protein
MRVIKNLVIASTISILGALLLLLVATLLSKQSEAKELINLNKAGVQYHQFLYPSRDAFIVPSLSNTALNSQIKLTLDMDIFNYFYWRNNIFSITDKILGEYSYSQFRYVSWEYQLGLRVTKNLNLEFYHRSEHLLDAVSTINYPMVNSVGISYTIYSNPKPAKSLF